MDQLLAALILACTQLSSRMDQDWHYEKTQCVRRVTACALPVSMRTWGDLDRVQELLKQCAKEVHL